MKTYNKTIYLEILAYVTAYICDQVNEDLRIDLSKSIDDTGFAIISQSLEWGINVQIEDEDFNNVDWWGMCSMHDLWESTEWIHDDNPFFAMLWENIRNNQRSELSHIIQRKTEFIYDLACCER